MIEEFPFHGNHEPSIHEEPKGSDNNNYTNPYGELAKVNYEDSDENGIIEEGVFIESEFKGTIFKATKTTHNKDYTESDNV